MSNGSYSFIFIALYFHSFGKVLDSSPQLQPKLQHQGFWGLFDHIATAVAVHLSKKKFQISNIATTPQPQFKISLLSVLK